VVTEPPITNVVIEHTSIAAPAHVLSQQDVKRTLQDTLSVAPARLKAISTLLDSAAVERRCSVLPLDALRARRSLTETMALYRTHAISLGLQVAADCLQDAGVAPQQVDLVITVSCTGVMLPSLDAYLANDLGLRPDVRRLPITELGCAAGAAALARGRDYLIGHPGARVLIVSVELPSLCFQRDDSNLANLVSLALFGDGAAAVLLNAADGEGVQIVETRSHLFPRSLDALGFDLHDDGFHIVLAKELPNMVRREFRGLVDALLAPIGLTPAQLGALLLHPGGRKILEAIEDVLGVERARLSPSWDVLREYGNMSSAAVLFVLHAWLTRREPVAGSYGLMAAFGPGFSTELLLLRWT
jgi:alkylresorcinol/alkylpyrone synthase